MIPQTAAAVLAFLALVAPGIVFQNLYEQRKPAVDQTPFREASGIALASLSFSILSILLLAVVRARIPAIMPDPGRWLREGNRYVQDDYRLVAWFSLAELLLAIFLAAAWSWLCGLGRAARIVKVSTWYRLFRELRPKGTDTFVRVSMYSGVEYFGMVIEYSIDLELADRELFLGEPLWRRLPGETDFTSLQVPWRWLILPGPAIQSIWVSFLQSPSEPPKGRPIEASLEAQAG